MDVLYIFLGGKVAKRIDAMSSEMFVTYDEGANDAPGALLWPATGLQRPLTYLIKQARESTWRVKGRQVLERYKAVSSRAHWLTLDPEQVAKSDRNQFNRSDGATGEDQENALIFLDLQHIARQIIHRKTAFVFPEKWPSNITIRATKLLEAMVKDVCEYFRKFPSDSSETSEESDLPWTFLSMSPALNNQGPLGDFIRSLHHEMLGDTSDVNVADWRRKGGAILLSGPTGSGKSYAARLLAADPRYKSPPVEINLAAINEEQLENRMRGYVAGTFTDADKKGRKGWFEEADGGVLFLDEFQSVSPAAQVQLLDVLSAVSDEIQIARTGADHSRSPFKVKVILAINEDIEILLREKRLRKDLYYRIRFVQTFPSLKERLAPDRDPHHRYLRGMLASYRWKSLRTVQELCESDAGLYGMQRSFFPILRSEALSTLAKQEWEGNFRELERVAFDLFHRYDDFYEQDYYQIGKLEVENILKLWNVLASISPPIDSADGMTLRKLEMLQGIQDALRESRFIIDRVLKNQPYFLSRPTLKSYLLENFEQLSPDIKVQSRIIDFLDL
jgi:hypothetical protein